MDSTDALSRSGCRERRLNKTVMSDYIKLHSGFRFAYLKLTYDFLVQKNIEIRLSGGAPVDGESVTSLLLMNQRKFGGGLENARQLNDTVCPTVAFTDRGLSVHCGLPARVYTVSTKTKSENF